MKTYSATNIHKMTEELHKAFSILNKRFFENQIPLPAITIQSHGNRSLSMGWCTTKEVWGDKTGKQKMYEINLSAEFIDVSFVETMDTLMHEMVHLYNIVKDIKDVSRNGTYHNKRFKDRALKSGFEYPHDKPDKKYGFSFVRLSPATVAILNELPIDQSVFSIGRKSPDYFTRIDNGEDPENASVVNRNNQKSFRWICPECEMILRSTKPELNIICGDCDEQLIQVNKKRVD